MRLNDASRLFTQTASPVQVPAIAPRNTRIPDQQHFIRLALLHKRSYAGCALVMTAFDSIRWVKTLF